MPPAPSLPKLGSSGSTPPRGGTRGSLTGDLSGGRSRGSGRPSRSALWGLIGAGAVILAVLVILITQVFSGGGSKPAKTSAASPPVIPTRTSGTPSRESFTVTVLNGTTVLNLARSVSDRISAKGYKVIKVDNAPEQGRAATTISYTPGHRADALTVANLVNVGRDAVAPLDPNTQVVSQGASVVVTVGADQSR
jgi:hypothetical protein